MGYPVTKGTMFDFDTHPLPGNQIVKFQTSEGLGRISWKF